MLSSRSDRANTMRATNPAPEGPLSSRAVPSAFAALLCHGDILSPGDQHCVLFGLQSGYG